MAMYRLTTDAQEDLIKVRHYTLKNWGSQQSAKYLAELQHTIQLLSEAPDMGKKRSDILIDSMSFPHASHVIYYLQQQKTILVFAILHKSMVPNNHLESRSKL